MAKKHDPTTETRSDKNGNKITLRENYFGNPRRETGAEISYNIRQARKQPELLEQHIQKNNSEIIHNEQESASQNWEQTKKIAHETIIQTYPNIAQNDTTQMWGRKGYEHATTEEKAEYVRPSQARNEIQRKINTGFRWFRMKKKASAASFGVAISFRPPPPKRGNGQFSISEAINSQFEMKPPQLGRLRLGIV